MFLLQNELRIAVLPGHLSYDAPWPVRKVPLRCTPYFLAYHMESKVSWMTMVSSLLHPPHVCPPSSVPFPSSFFPSSSLLLFCLIHLTFILFLLLVCLLLLLLLFLVFLLSWLPLPLLCLSTTVCLSVLMDRSSGYIDWIYGLVLMPCAIYASMMEGLY